MDLITGGAGFVGSHLVDRLLTEGRPLRVVDSFLDRPGDAGTRQERNATRWGKAVDLRRVDIRDRSGMFEALEGITRVFHLAAYSGVRESILDPDRTIDINVRGTSVLLGAMEERRVDQLVLCSSSSVYGPTDGRPSEERDPPRPASPYGATKVAAESLAFAWQHLCRGSLVIVRPFSVYGPRQRPDMAVSRFLSAVLDDRMLPMFGDGLSTRDYTYVTDVVELIARAGTLRSRRPRILNAGAGQPVDLRTLIEQIGRVVGSPGRVELIPSQPGDVRFSHANIDKAQDLLNWQPRVELAEGLRRSLLWLRANNSKQ